MSLQSKIRKLKDIAAQYETSDFLTFIAGALIQIPHREESYLLKNLKSPMMQLFFLAQLNLNKNSTINKKGFDKADWEAMTLLLHEIEVEYFYLLGFPKSGAESQEEIEKIKVTMPTFMNYFFNGPLTYPEQEIEKIEKIFKPFSDIILQEFNITIAELITFHTLIADAVDRNLALATKFLDSEVWQSFTKQCVEKGLEPEEWIGEVSEEIHAYINLHNNPGNFLVVDINTIDYSMLSIEKFEHIINLFTSTSYPKDAIQYYTDDIELLKKPFIKVSEKKYLAFFQKQYLRACYNMLFNKVLQTKKDSLLKSRDNFVELKTEAIFRKFFKSDAHYYSNYSINNGKSEQDILILLKNTALIIEVKASSYRAPMRDAEKAFDKLKTDFEKCIQYGFEQTTRVVNAFASTDELSILDSNNHVLYTVQTKKYKTYSIIVTLERYGHIQTNLGEMLDIQSEDDFPWCVCLDDLEAFILTLAKRSNKINSLITFLEYRKQYHGHLICTDELELCGSFLINEKEFINKSMLKDTVVTMPDLTEPIEKCYREGMGFEKERYWKQKRNRSVHFY